MCPYKVVSRIKNKPLFRMGMAMAVPSARECPIYYKFYGFEGFILGGSMYVCMYIYNIYIIYIYIQTLLSILEVLSVYMHVNNNIYIYYLHTYTLSYIYMYIYVYIYIRILWIWNPLLGRSMVGFHLRACAKLAPGSCALRSAQDESCADLTVSQAVPLMGRALSQSYIADMLKENTYNDRS